MSRIPDDVKQFMTTHGVSQDEIWLLPGGRAYAIKHGALERIADAKGIKFDAPQIVEADGAQGIATILVHAIMGDVKTWSFGEASPKNNKNAYCFAMAEKRAKDRCILKLLNSHGAIYSEDEADDFKRPATAQKPEPEPQQPDQSTLAFRDAVFMAFQSAQTVDALDQSWLENKPTMKTMGMTQDDPTYQEIVNEFKRCKRAFTDNQKEAA